MSTRSRYNCIYQSVLDYATPLAAFAAPWAFVRPSADCYSAIADPTDVLRHLLTQFDIPLLQQSGVLAHEPGGEPRLAPALCEMGGVIIPLRTRIGRQPFALVTQQGCLPRHLHPIRAATRDFFTRTLAREHGALIACANIQEVAIYRSLRLPVALMTELSVLSERGLRALDALFEFDMPDELDFDSPATPAASSPKGPHANPAPPAPAATPLPATNPPVAPNASQLPPATLPPATPAPDSLHAAPNPLQPPTAPLPSAPSNYRPMLLLAGWSLLTINKETDPRIREAAAYFINSRKHLEIEFHGVSVSELDDDALEQLCFCAKLQTIDRVRDILIKRGLQAERCLEFLRDGGPKINDYPTALAELESEYAGGSGNNPHSPSVEYARKRYEEVVRGSLIDPLRRMGESSGDPLTRVAHIHLANIAEMIHKMTPMIADQQRRAQYTVRLSDDEAPIPAKSLRQFGMLSGQFVEMLKTVRKLESDGDKRDR